MKQTIKTGFAALLLLLVISCKKESSTVQSSDITSLSVTQDFSTDNRVLAGHTVKIGKQVWLTKNVDVSHYKNGDRIPQVKNPAAWASLTTGAWCWFNNDSTTDATYGKLYNWYAVTDPRGLGPIGWHIPSYEEWTTLFTFLGGPRVAGGRMKEAGTLHWAAPNSDATNLSGFTGLGIGRRFPDGTFHSFGYEGWWWATTEYVGNSELAMALVLFSEPRQGGTIGIGKLGGFSVRCIRD